MNIDIFWKLIDKSRKLGEGDPEAQSEALQTLLKKLSADDILLFQKIFDAYADLSYRSLLWAAFYIKEGGCSDDGFDYCRWGLIAMGRKAFEEVLLNPDAMAKAKYDDLEENEDIMMAADAAYAAMTESEEAFYEKRYELPKPDMTAEYQRLGLDPAYKLADDPVQALDFDDEDAMRPLLPKMLKKYWD
jgi:hypothetical protein